MGKSKGEKMSSRGFTLITLKNGNTVSNELVSGKDGWYFLGKKVAPLRNYMQAEAKAHKLFRELKNEFKKKGTFKHAYSSMWFENDSSHTSTWEKRPVRISPLKNYGTNSYTLEFTVRKNIKNVGGEWHFDTTYYHIQWEPTTPITIFIEKVIYTKIGKRTAITLAPHVPVTNKAKVIEYIRKFKKLYQKVKKGSK